MKKWSDKLIELSKEYLNYSGTRVKSQDLEFGTLIIDYNNSIYTIHISNSNKIVIFKSINEIINSGWVVD